jgi:2-keto-4-pentenoate hydratase/2-oxohepta-3-ene-1,7-dioic acid hydratase in catechol pathway
VTPAGPERRSEVLADYVLGYTVVNDVTNVDATPLTRRASRAMAAMVTPPIGPRIEAELDKPDQWPSPSWSTEP